MADEKTEAVAPDPYRCVHYPSDKNKCAKYLYDETSKRWDIYDGDVPCSECAHYFTADDIEYLKTQGMVPFEAPE
jgi:hypothetical protein